MEQTINIEELTMDVVKTHVNYDASDDIKAAIAGASLSWAKAEDGNENENPGTEQGGRGASDEYGVKDSQLRGTK